MRITPTPVASAPKRVLARRDWRPLTTGEAVVAVVVDFLLLVVVVLVPLLALNVRALPWILLTQVIAVQSLVLARFGRTAGLATVLATVVVPQQGVAPGIGRALARVLLPILLPFQIGRRTSAGQQDEDRERLLDRLTGTMTVTRRPTPKQERRRSAVQTRSEPRRVRRGSKDGAPSPVVPEAATRRRMRDGGRRPSAGSVAAGPPMLQPQAPAVRERPYLAGPAAVSDSGAGRSRFAPPVSSPAAPVSSPAPPPAAPSPAVPIPPPDSPPPSSVPAESGPPPATPSVFAAPAAPPGPPPTSSMPTRRVSATRSVSSNAPIPPSAPVEASAPLPPSLPPRIHPGRRKVVPPVPPVSPSDAPASPSVSGAHSTSRGGAPSGASPVSGGVAGSAQDQSPVVPPLAAASPVTPPGPGRLDSSIPSGPISVQPVARRPGRSDAQRRRPKVSRWQSLDVEGRVKTP